MPTIRFKSRFSNTKMPIKGSTQCAGFDLFAAQVVVDLSQEQLIVDTGLTVSFDPGYVLMLYGRSGLAAKYGIRLSNGVGIIDADYRGPLKVLLRSDLLELSEMLQHVKPGDRVAQAILMPLLDTSWQEVEELDSTERGEGGFGSTGAC